MAKKKVIVCDSCSNRSGQFKGEFFMVKVGRTVRPDSTLVVDEYSADLCSECVPSIPKDRKRKNAKV